MPKFLRRILAWWRWRAIDREDRLDAREMQEWEREMWGLCLECGQSRKDCERIWKGQRKCCPDCTHMRTAVSESSEHP